MEFKIIYNPLKIKTSFLVNGEPDNRKNSKFREFGEWAQARLQSWIDDLPRALNEEFNEDQYNIIFEGTELDSQDVAEALEDAKREFPRVTFNLSIEIRRSPENALGQLSDIYEELKDSGQPEFTNDIVEKAFSMANNIEFPVNVIATMSSGKSTLLNALLGKRILPAANEATTAKTTEIHDNDDLAHFRGWAYNDDNQEDFRDEVNLETMNAWNDDHNELGEKVTNIKLEGDVSFVSDDIAELVLVDTPGPNNSQDSIHEARTYDVIANEPKTLIIYVMNATQLKTNDDKKLLDKISESMRGSKQARDRFLFVVNKLDTFKEGDNIKKTMHEVQEYLHKELQIDHAQIFGTSASTALEIRTVLAETTNEEIDTDQIGRRDSRSHAVGDVWDFVDIPDTPGIPARPAKHLEAYGEVPASLRMEIHERLKKAENENDIKTQALIHSGIPTLEAAIRQYVEKYSKSNKIKAVVDSFEETVNAAQRVSELKDAINSDNDLKENVDAGLNTLGKSLASESLIEQFRERVQSLTDKSNTQSGDDNIFASKQKVSQELRKRAADEQRKMQADLVRQYDVLNPQNEVEIAKILNDYAKESQMTAMSKFVGAIHQDAQNMVDVFDKNLKAIITKLGNDVELSKNGVELTTLLDFSSSSLAYDANQTVSDVMSNANRQVADIQRDKEFTKDVHTSETYDTGARWYKFWTWGQDRYETRDVVRKEKYTKKVTVADNKEISEYLKVFFVQFKAQSTRQLDERAEDISKKVAAALIKQYGEKVSQLEQELNGLKDKLSSEQDHSQSLQTKIEKNEVQLKWLQSITDRIQMAISLQK